MKSAMQEPLEGAVVGAGGAGIVAARMLSRRHRVALFERGSYCEAGFRAGAVGDPQVFLVRPRAATG